MKKPINALLASAGLLVAAAGVASCAAEAERSGTPGTDNGGAGGAATGGWAGATNTGGKANTGGNSSSGGYAGSGTGGQGGGQAGGGGSGGSATSTGGAAGQSPTGGGGGQGGGGQGGGGQGGAGQGGGGGGYVVSAAPAVNGWTPAFTANTSCTCSVSETDCHTLYVGRVTAINGNTAWLEFEKTGGGGPSVDVHYWVVVGADTYPSCLDLAAFVARTDGNWTAASAPLPVSTNIWPDQASLANATCGETKKMFIISGGAGGYENQRLWFQKQAIVFTKTCP